VQLSAGPDHMWAQNRVLAKWVRQAGDGNPLECDLWKIMALCERRRCHCYAGMYHQGKDRVWFFFF
jgi:hypothetical protein